MTFENWFEKIKIFLHFSPNNASTVMEESLSCDEQIIPFKETPQMEIQNEGPFRCIWIVI